jgi:pyrroloquinoline quinone biosynthesis protein B
VRRGFTDGNVLYRTLQRFPGQTTWRALELGRELALTDPGRAGGLRVQATAVPGKPPVHLEGLTAPAAEDNVGLRIVDVGTGGVLAYLSSVGQITPAVREVMAGAGCVFFDGTFWSADELPAQGLGDKRAQQMAHWPVGGFDGSLAALAGIEAPRRLFIHVNNTNPLLREDSPERAAAEAAGWEIAYDGLEVTL